MDLRAFLTGLAAIVAAASPVASHQATPAAVTFRQATSITAPANGHRGYAPDSLDAASCVKAGDCVAGGWYTDTQDSQQAMVVTETAGHWKRALELALPGNANPVPFASVSAVYCPAIGYCTAAGNYNGSTRQQGFIATERAGKWATAIQVTPPANSAAKPVFSLGDIVCTARGYCVATGSYLDHSHTYEPMVVAEAAGTWKRAVEVKPPSQTYGAGLVSIACPNAGNCSAVGGSEQRSGANQLFAVSETAGHWRPTTIISLPTGVTSLLQDNLSGLACTHPGNCVAVGSYQDLSGELHLIAVNESHGSWQRATRITVLPAGASSHQFPVIGPVACISAGSCVAVGHFNPSHGGSTAMAELESAGSWSKATTIQPPRNTEPKGNTEALAVACTRSGYCLAVGQYSTNITSETAMAAASR
jgi:hypothetical protein